VVTYCNAKGDCTPEQPFCGGGECKGPDDCPAPEGACKQCPNGKLSCPQPTCNGGLCGAQYPACDSIECSSPKECPVDDGCAVCPDGSLSCPQPTCEGGKCGSFFPGCKAECSSPKECPAPKGPCQQCDDGTLSCPTATCEGGKCGVAYPGCGGVQCKTPDQCPVPGVCQLCPDGSASCAQPTCEGGKCGVTFPPCPGGNACEPVLVKADPSCKKMLGYYWDGKACQPLNGCECVGDCKKLVGSYDECVKLYSPCTDPVPQCKIDAECPAPKGPCKICDDGSAACPKGVCQNGQCSVVFEECKNACSAMEAVGVGDCKKLLGFAWNGKDCVSLSGCQCEGADCGKLAGTYDKCIEPYKTCTKPSTPCSGKKCGDTCSTCVGDICPGVVEYCNMKGECTTEKPACVFPLPPGAAGAMRRPREAGAALSGSRVPGGGDGQGDRRGLPRGPGDLPGGG
jgi:hypothetical protein